MEKKRLVPKLRFPEFEGNGDWEEELFNRLYSFKGTNTFTRDEMNCVIGSVHNIHYGDIHTKFHITLDISKIVVPYLNASVPINKVKQDCYCKDGDIIFADASEDLDGIGKCIEIVNVHQAKVLAGLHTLLTRPITNKILIGFAGYLFSSNNMHEQIQKEAQGIKVLSISSGRLANTNVVYPKSKQEQQKIASCLSSIDTLISAHSQKLDALKTYKKGLMQQLFPAEGETVPRLRFAGFEGEWEETKLGIIAGIINEKLKTKKCTLLSVTSGVGFIPQSEKFGKEIAGESYKNYYVIRKWDFAYNKSATKLYPEGYIAMLRDYEVAAVPNSIFTCFRIANRNVLPQFIDCMFQNNLHGNWLRKFIEIGARAHGALSVNSETLLSMPILIPTTDEQQKIASCLSSIDTLITAQFQKLEALKAHKKGLMQQLFPQTNE